MDIVTPYIKFCSIEARLKIINAENILLPNALIVRKLIQALQIKMLQCLEQLAQKASAISSYVVQSAWLPKSRTTQKFLSPIFLTDPRQVRYANDDPLLLQNGIKYNSMDLFINCFLSMTPMY